MKPTNAMAPTAEGTAMAAMIPGAMDWDCVLLGVENEEGEGP